MNNLINTIQLGNCYELIKQIPDKSIDLVYIDIPYLINTGGGGGNSSLAQRIEKKQKELGVKNAKRNMENRLKEYREKMINAKTKSEYEKYHCLHSNLLNNINLKTANIADGIDYSIFEELVRVMKYIYIYGVVKNKYMIL